MVIKGAGEDGSELRPMELAAVISPRRHRKWWIPERAGQRRWDLDRGEEWGGEGSGSARVHARVSEREVALGWIDGWIDVWMD